MNNDHRSSGFMDFMGYRYMIIEDKIKECLQAAKRGETDMVIDRGDQTEEEAKYLQQEVRRRIEIGDY